MNGNKRLERETARLCHHIGNGSESLRDVGWLQWTAFVFLGIPGVAAFVMSGMLLLSVPFRAVPGMSGMAIFWTMIVFFVSGVLCLVGSGNGRRVGYLLVLVVFPCTMFSVSLLTEMAGMNPDYDLTVSLFAAAAVSWLVARLMGRSGCNRLLVTGQDLRSQNNSQKGSGN